ncbi:MAG TPA: YkgJ family cysteine cluster protein [Thermoguttaceae bacterium]
MTLPIQTLPIVERWACHNCGMCCHGTTFHLSDEDLRKLREQNWENHPDFRGIKIVTRHGWLQKYYRLGKRPDGACIFLTEDNLCRIHRDFGEAAKPLTCRLFPFQLVPLEKFAYVTLRQYCPSAVADNGRPLAEHFQTIVKLAAEGHLTDKPITLPAIVPGLMRTWDDLLNVAAALDRLMLDDRYPVVRRLVHGLRFCDFLEQQHMNKLDGEQLKILVEALAISLATDKSADDFFNQPRWPDTGARLLFRQILFEYLRLHPDYHTKNTWTERWRVIRGATTFARGKGRLKFTEAYFPATTFEILDQPMGPIPIDVLSPLDRFFEKGTASRQYLLLGDTSWTLVDCFRAMAISHAVAMWLLRLTCGAKPPVMEDVFKVVRAIDRGQGYDGLISRRHKRRIASLNRLGELPRLLAWYSR